MKDLGDGALDGVRVVELGGGVSAGYTTKLLADLGADVVKIEPPDGDPLRFEGPEFPPRSSPLRSSALFRYLNRGKRSLFADLTDPAGRATTLRALGDAEIVVESLGAGGLERLGIAPAELTRAHRVAVVRISPFGQDGPYTSRATSDLTLQALGGWVSNHGVLSSPPVQLGGRLHDYTTASYAAAAALTAWRAARFTDHGTIVDVSEMECLVGSYPYLMVMASDMRRYGLPATHDRQFPVPGIVQCADGWVGINVLTGQHFFDVCAMMQVEEYATRQAEIASGGALLAEFYARIQPWLDERSVMEVVDTCELFRIPAAPVADAPMILDFGQLHDRDFFVQDEGLPVPGPPYRLSVTPAQPRLNDAPVELDASGPAWAEGATHRPASPVGRADLPFHGLKILDVTNFWAGPICAMYFGALGADVIKVESRRRPDGMRFSGALPVMGKDWYDRSGVFAGTNLNKRSLTLELDRPEGREIFLRLAAETDVVIENFAARVMEQFSLSFDDLRAVNPDLIMVRMPAFGLEGRWRDRVGWAMVIEQASGMAFVTGHPDLPMHPGGIADAINGMHAAVALQAAIEHREVTGEGQLIEVAQLETGINLMAELLFEWTLKGTQSVRHGNRDERYAPQGVYRCAGDAGDRVALTVVDDDQWGRFAEAIGRPEWRQDPRFRTLADRWQHHDLIDEAIERWTGGLTANSVVEALRALGVPAARPLLVEDTYDDPQLVARAYFQELPHDKAGPRRYPGWPMQFSFLEAHHRFGAPAFGAHSRTILGELGFTEDQVLDCERTGLIGTEMM